MKYLLALVLVLFSTNSWAISMTQQNCSWDKPGLNPYKGTVSDAVDYYLDIPRKTREILKSRITANNYDEVVDITKQGIFGKRGYGPTIEEMHFGPNLICTNVTRTRWPETMVQKGSMYCEDKYCILVPAVCGNISRVRKAENVPPRPSFKIPEGYLPPSIQTSTPLPEPGSVALMVLGLASLVLVRKKRK